jgi:hypothetical protein
MSELISISDGRVSGAVINGIASMANICILLMVVVALSGLIIRSGCMDYIIGKLNTHIIRSKRGTELTIFSPLFVLLQWWNLLNARVLGSCHSAFRRLWACRVFLLVLAMILAGQWLIVTFGGELFRTEPLSWQTWLWMMVGTSPVLWIGEAYRKIKG